MLSGTMRAHDRQVCQRRDLLRALALGATGAGLFAALPALAQDAIVQETTSRALRGMRTPRIADIVVIEVALGMGGSPLTVVKVVTDQPGLHGFGEATLSGRSRLVKLAVNEYLKPLLVGRNVDRIEDIWQVAYLSSYYKNDHAQNSAISGVTDALWDIKGRLAGMPVHQLVGGKFRDGAEVYMHALATGLEPRLVVENSRKLIAQGVRNIQLDIFGRDAPGKTPEGAKAYDRDLAMRKLVKAFETLRGDVGNEIRLGLDIHSMLDSNRSVALMKSLESLGPWYWIEDPLAPEEQGYLPMLRTHSPLPIAMGEMYNNPAEWRPLIANRLIDYLRVHISHIGGFTVARRVAALAEGGEVRTGWHGSNDISPIGHMARLTLDVTAPNFGIHEHFAISDQLAALFPGAKQMRNGFAFVNDGPGWGIEVDEAAIAKLPAPTGHERNFESRQPDGSAAIGVG